METKGRSAKRHTLLTEYGIDVRITEWRGRYCGHRNPVKGRRDYAIFLAHMGKEELIGRLGLRPLPREGGFFRFIAEYGNGAGAIYYLIDENQFSHLHSLTEDEIWLFLEGDAVEQTTVSPEGVVSRVVLGPGNRTSLVPGNTFQATRIRKVVCGYALFCTMMSPRYRDDMYTHGSDVADIRSMDEVSDLI